MLPAVGALFGKIMLIQNGHTYKGDQVLDKTGKLFIFSVLMFYTFISVLVLLCCYLEKKNHIFKITFVNDALFYIL